jgi:hypothetical protein
LGFVLLSCARLFAQTSPADSLLAAAQNAYYDGDFMQAELSALRGLKEVETQDKLAEIPFRVILGSVYVAREQSDFAYREFLLLTSINPGYDLDPAATSPKILEVFRNAKRDYMEKVMSEPAIYRMPQADVRMAASWRSLMVPGWGQFYKKQDTKGAAFAAAQLLSLTALLVMQAEVNRRHDDYRAIREYNSPLVEDRYQEYRRAYQTRNGVGYFTLGIYLLNYLDALYAPVRHKK